MAETQDTVEATPAQGAKEKRPKKDLTGWRFGRWTVLSFSHGQAKKRQLRWFWSCRCDCGTCKPVSGEYLIGGQSQSCGCYKAEASHARSADYTGKTFGRWTVIRYVGLVDGAGVWHCRCECGTEQERRVKTLRMSGSCGCFKSEVMSRIKRTHGCSSVNGNGGTPEYRTWRGMITRCVQPVATGYADYGGRGIRVCDRWLTSFENFLADVGPRPEGHSLDRIDGNGHYEPGNVRWATSKEQNNNRRGNRMLTLGERTQSLARWAEQLDLTPSALVNRLRLGWSIEKALTTPKQVHGDHGRRTADSKVVWQSMRYRCESPTNASYADYGGRGIKVCQRWRESYEAFSADMGPRPSSAHTLDRINNDGDYEPENCRWATKVEQSNNRRGSVVLTCRGEAKPLADWSRETGIAAPTISARLKAGWSVEKALSSPSRPYKSSKEQSS